MTTPQSWPFHDGTTGTPVLEDQWSIMARHWAATGVAGHPNDTSLQVYANASGREVHVRAGRACVRGHWLDLDAQTDLAVAANTSGSLRYDLVVARLNPSANAVALAVIQGVPGGLLPPTPTRTDTGIYDLPLAMVSVANGAAVINTPDVADLREYTSVPIQPCLSGRLPAYPTVIGQRAYEVDTGIDRVWNGAGWVPLKANPINEPAHARAWRVSNQSGLVAGWNAVTYADHEATAAFDGAVNLGYGQVTIPHDGVWLLTGATVHETSDHHTAFYATSTGSERWGHTNRATSGYVTTSAVRWLPAGDVVSLTGYRNGLPPMWAEASFSVTELSRAALA